MPTSKLTKKKTYAKAFARLGGLARAAGMTPEQRSKAARKAAKARWARWKKPT